MSISDTYLLAIRTHAIQNRGVPITYKRFVSANPNLKTGDVGPEFEEIEIAKALVSGEMKDDQGLFRLVKILASEIEGRPSLKDELEIDDEALIIFDWSSSQHENVFVLKVKKT